MDKLKELLDSEKKFVQSLSLLLNEYGNYIERSINNFELIQLPEDLKGGKYQFVFSNVQELLHFHEK